MKKREIGMDSHETGIVISDAKGLKTFEPLSLRHHEPRVTPLDELLSEQGLHARQESQRVLHMSFEVWHFVDHLVFD